jgi:glyoxylase-like metal-dependent hydrolase (beta-lactamase superfamily II)
MLENFRILEPQPNVLAFYDGRVAGYRFADGDNWVDDGALSLGIASYAIVDGKEALVYDTHVSLEHARAIREALSARGVEKFTVVLSHWHLDHIAGNEVFADCEIIACTKTAAHLARHRTAIESGTYEGPPAISPLVMPTRTFDDRLSVRIGNTDVELMAFDIHSDDGVVLWLRQRRLLLAGDTLEDTVTYVAEPESLPRHLPELDRLANLGATHILPNHGCPDRIAAGGYGASLIPATARYVHTLLATKTDASLRATALRDLIARELEDGTLIYLDGYEPVHALNIRRVLAV